MNKKQFCSELAKLLQKTEQHKDLAQLEYYKDKNGEEWVTPAWKTEEGGCFGKSICVTADSETAIIKDVLKGIE